MQNLTGKLWSHHIFNNNFRKRNRQVTRSSIRGRAWEYSIQNLSRQLKSLGSGRAASAGMLPLDVLVQSCNTTVLGETVQEETRCPEHWVSQKYQQKEWEGCSHTTWKNIWTTLQGKIGETTNLTACRFCCWQQRAAQGQLRRNSAGS